MAVLTVLGFAAIVVATATAVVIQARKSARDHQAAEATALEDEQWLTELRDLNAAMPRVRKHRARAARKPRAT